MEYMYNMLEHCESWFTNAEYRESNDPAIIEYAIVEASKDTVRKYLLERYGEISDDETDLQEVLSDFIEGIDSILLQITANGEGAFGNETDDDSGTDNFLSSQIEYEVSLFACTSNGATNMEEPIVIYTTNDFKEAKDRYDEGLKTLYFKLFKE